MKSALASLLFASSRLRLPSSPPTSVRQFCDDLSGPFHSPAPAGRGAAGPAAPDRKLAIDRRLLAVRRTSCRFRLGADTRRAAMVVRRLDLAVPLLQSQT